MVHGIPQPEFEVKASIGRATSLDGVVWVKDPEPLLYHAEVIYRNNKAVGYIRAASYGFTLGGAVGLAMIEAGEPLNKTYIQEGEWEIDIAGKRYPVGVSLRPMYDPKMERIKA